MWQVIWNNLDTIWAYFLFDCWQLLWHGWSNASQAHRRCNVLEREHLPKLVAKHQVICRFAPLFPLGILPPWSPRPRPALLMCLDSGNAWRKSREKIHGWRVNCRMLRFVCLWWLIKGWTGMDSRDVVCCDCYLSQNTCISSDRSRNAQDSKRIQALNLYRHWLSLLQPQLKLVRTLDVVLEAYTSYTA